MESKLDCPVVVVTRLRILELPTEEGERRRKRGGGGVGDRLQNGERGGRSLGAGRWVRGGSMGERGGGREVVEG